MFGKPKDKSEFTILPMVPIRDVVLFPYMMIPFVIGRPCLSEGVGNCIQQ